MLLYVLCCFRGGYIAYLLPVWSRQMSYAYGVRGGAALGYSEPLYTKIYNLKMKNEFFSVSAYT